MKLGNLKDVEPWRAGGPPPPGNYIARVDDAKEGKSSGGHPQVEISWTVAEGEYSGAEIREWLVVLETTRGKVVALLQAVGIDIPDGDFELKVADLVGRHAQIFCRSEPSYKDPDKMVTKVAGYKPAPAQAIASGNGSNGGSAGSSDDLPF